jgi:plasmid stabilization system protein ParE
VLLTRLLEAAGGLAELSDRGRVVPELGDPVLRELLVDPYRLLYEVHADDVQVVALLHQRREFERWRRGAL